MAEILIRNITDAPLFIAKRYIQDGDRFIVTPQRSSELKTNENNQVGR